MEKEKAERAKELLRELEMLEEIKGVTVKERTHWWMLVTPDRKDSLYFPDSLRKNFTEAVEKSIREVENELKKL